MMPSKPNLRVAGPPPDPAPEGPVTFDELFTRYGRYVAQLQPRLLGYGDAGKPESAPGSPRFLDVPLDEAVRRIVEHIRQFRPDVVLT